jgi:hypothetical protein
MKISFLSLLSVGQVSNVLFLPPEGFWLQLRWELRL